MPSTGDTKVNVILVEVDRPLMEKKSSTVPGSFSETLARTNTSAFDVQKQQSAAMRSQLEDRSRQMNQGFTAGMAQAGALLNGNITWNWEHKTGYKPYDDKAQLIIEGSYRAGATKVRLKTGKKGNTPMEIFFEDMIQYDPETTNSRKIQRAGPIDCWTRMERTINALKIYFETGKPARESFAHYQKRRHDALHPQEKYKVENQYYGHGEGVCQAVAKSTIFFSLTMVLVVFNAVWIAIDLDHNPAAVITEAKLQFRVVEYFLTTYFLLELIIRFGAFRNKCMAFKDKWFCFDGFLVFLAVFEAWIVPLAFAIVKSDDDAEPPSLFKSLQCLRMFRLMRLTKLIRSFPQLMTIIKGIVKSLQPMLVTVVLLIILLFVFGVIFRSVFKDTPEMEEFFGAVSQSSWTLLLYGTLLDGPGALLAPMWKVQPIMCWVFLMFIFLSSFTVLNMLIGVLCEVVSGVTAEEKEQAEIDFLDNNMRDILDCYDKNEDGKIGRNEFDLLMNNLEVKDLFREFGTDIDTFKELKDSMFSDSEANDDKLTFDELLHKVNELKGDTPAKVVDVVRLREYVRGRFECLEAGQKYTGDEGARPGSAASGTGPDGLDGTEPTIPDIMSGNKPRRQASPDAEVDMLMQARRPSLPGDAPLQPDAGSQPWDLVLNRLDEMEHKRDKQSAELQARLSQLEGDVRKLVSKLDLTET